MFHQINELMVLGMHPASPYLRRNRSAPTGDVRLKPDATFHYRMYYNLTVHFVYMVRCADGTLYTGYARDPEKRAKAHNTGRGAKYTAQRRPVSLVYAEECPSRGDALKREHQLKRLPRAKKETLASARSNQFSVT